MRISNIYSCLLVFLGLLACTHQGAQPEASHGAPALANQESALEAGAQEPLWDSFKVEQNPSPQEISNPATSIELDKNGFRLNGEYTLLRGGSLQWFKIPETEWLDRLQRFKAAGFNAIDMYVAWNLHEPKQGEFDFETYDIRGFLELADSLGLYIYLRPGPYFTNEWNGGGLPEWLLPHTTKESIEADGLYNLRTPDPDYLEVSARYLNELNQVVSPYFIENGGPIILYSVENEYDWFEQIFDGEKDFQYNGKPERPRDQVLNTGEYLGELRDIVRESSASIPITTCPGKPQVSGMGDVEGVVPMPNIYCNDYLEKRALDIVKSMHDPEQFGGAYVDFPSASTETNRSPAMMKRLIMGGLDGYFGFNIFGSHQEGRNNAVVAQVNGPDTRCYGDTPAALSAFQPETIFDVSFDNLFGAFVSPIVGYFHNVVDYGGIVTPSGVMRPQFHQFRRANLFFDDFQNIIGGQEYPNRSGGWWFFYEDSRVAIDQYNIGAAEGWWKYHYWYEGSNGTKILSVLNESHYEQVIAPHGIEFDGEIFPKYTELTVPAESFPQGGLGDLESDYAMLLVSNLMLHDSLKMAYSTSEVLMNRELGQEKLLVVYGKSGTQGELVLENLGGDIDFTFSHGVELVEESDGRYSFIYTYGGLKTILVDVLGQPKVRIVIVTTENAGRTWHHSDELGASLVVGLDYALFERDSQGELEIRYEQEQLMTDVYLWSSSTSNSGFIKRRVSRKGRLDPLPDLSRGHMAKVHPLSNGHVEDERVEPGTELESLESYEFYKGHYLYEADVYLDRIPHYFWDERSLFVEHASDIVGIYVNGHYITTVVPMGTEINNGSWSSDYAFEDLVPYLKRGWNTVSFKVEIWGHGSFMWPRGTWSPTNFSAPALGFDALKGLYGEASLAGEPLENWRVTPIWRDDYILGSDLDEEGIQLPYVLREGETQRYTTHFSSDDLPSREKFHAPLVLELKGKSSKATIFLNGRLIGRWLSDNNWLRQGSWIRGRRDMWMTVNPDHFPIAPGILKANGEDNELVVLFEDVSEASSSLRGRVDSVRLTYSEEDVLQTDGFTEPLIHTWEKGILELSGE